MIINYIRNKFNDSLAALILFGGAGILIGVITALFFYPNHIGLGLLMCIFVGIFVGFLLMGATDGKTIAELSVITIIAELISFMSLIGLMEGSKYPLWISLLMIIVLTEILFLLNKTQPNETEDRMWFTTKRKIEVFIESSAIYLSLKGTYDVLSYVDYTGLYPAMVYVVEVLLSLIVIFAIVYVYIWMNSLRYKKNKGMK